MIHIYLKTIEGNQYSFLINPRFAITELQEVVMKQTGIANEDLRLIYRQRNLMEADKTKSIEDCGVEDHAVLHVVKRMPKCSCVQNAKKEATD
jgi:hypothetical protein